MIISALSIYLHIVLKYLLTLFMPKLEALNIIFFNVIINKNTNDTQCC